MSMLLFLGYPTVMADNPEQASQLIKKAIESLEDDECYDDSMVQ